MIKLDKEIELTGEGYTNSPKLLKQAWRDDSFAIYSRSEKDKKIYAYEVFKIPVVKKGFVWPGGKKTEEEDREFYPGASRFGKDAWICVSFELAKQKLDKFSKNAFNDEKIPEEKPVASGATLSGTFTIKEYADSVGLNYNDARKFVLENFKVFGKRNTGGKGKPSILYSK